MLQSFGNHARKSFKDVIVQSGKKLQGMGVFRPWDLAHTLNIFPVSPTWRVRGT